MIALDTNILIEIDVLNASVVERLKELRNEAPANPALPAPVVSEYYYGVLGTRKKEKALENIGKYEILNTSKDSALLFAEIKDRLKKSGQMLSDMDLLIAAICVDNSVTLVTSDRQFEKIKELNKIIVEV